MSATGAGRSRPELRAAARTAAFGVALYGGVRLVAAIAATSSMLASVLQAVLAEWGSGRLGITWSDPHAPLPSTSEIARRAGLGAALGVAGALLLIGAAAATHALALRVGDWSFAALAVLLVTSATDAIRDELLLRGVVLRTLPSVEAAAPRVLACVVVAAGAAAGEPTATWRGVLVRALLGGCFGALWVRDKGAWAAFGAHAAWSLALGVVYGGVFQAEVAPSAWAGGDAGPLGGWLAVSAALLFLALSLGDALRVGSTGRVRAGAR